MSNLKFDTLSNRLGTVSVPVPTVVSGVPKAWVNFNGTGTVAINDSFNVTSITDNGTGNYTINFTNAMPDTNYCITGVVHRTSAAGVYCVSGHSTISKTVSALQIYTKYAGTDGATDCEGIGVAIHSN